MDRNSQDTRKNSSANTRVLVVADWDIEAEAIVAACERRSRRRASAFQFIVPARLRGLDWAGDPGASLPCAGRQVETIARAATAAGLSFTSAAVGDPDVSAAIGDAVATELVDELLLCLRAPRFGLTHPFDLTHRVQRLAGIPVERIDLPRTRGKTVAGRVAKGIRLRPRCSPPFPQQPQATIS